MSSTSEGRARQAAAEAKESAAVAKTYANISQQSEEFSNQAAQSADAAFKFSKKSEQYSNESSAFAEKSAASAAAAKISENNAAATLASALKPGDYGIGGKGVNTGWDIALSSAKGQFLTAGNTAANDGPPPTTTAFMGINIAHTSLANYAFQIASRGNFGLHYRTNENGTVAPWARAWDTRNTTVDANGFIKKASPIARLSGAPEKMADDYLDGFTLSGCAAVNGEAAGVFAERVSIGIYKVTGALGFAEEGWNIEVPQDVNGNRLCFVSANTGKDGTIYVKVSKRRFDIDTAAIVAGEPMDIPAGRWIDLRLEMPAREVEAAPEAVEETAALENVNVDPI